MIAHSLSNLGAPWSDLNQHFAKGMDIVRMHEKGLDHFDSPPLAHAVLEVVVHVTGMSSVP